jgi:hypothetical protein
MTADFPKEVPASLLQHAGPLVVCRMYGVTRVLRVNPL